MINGASQGSNQQIWVPGTSEQVPSATAIPEAGRQAGAGALRWEYERICVSECITPSYWVGFCILMSICAYGGNSCWNAFSIFTLHWSSVMQQVCVCVHAYVHYVACAHVLKFKLIGILKSWRSQTDRQDPHGFWISDVSPRDRAKTP